MFDISSFLEKYISSDEQILLACSAGPDSMFLLYHILESSYKDNLIVCYFNHETRTECDEEQSFLLELGKKHGFQVEVSHYNFDNVGKDSPKKGFEELAREKRLDFFKEVLHKHDARYILTAHHLDDKIETYIFNMLRGSKLTGLINMTESSGGILRPLLGFEKKEIYNYLNTHGLIYFEDESNLNTFYTRNYLRNKVLPLFDQVHPEHKKNLQNLFTYFEEIKEHLDTEAQSFLGNSKDFSITNFHNLSSLLQKEVVKRIYYVSNNNSTIGLSEGNIAEVLKFINGKNNKTKKEIHGMNLFKDGDRVEY